MPSILLVSADPNVRSPLLESFRSVGLSATLLDSPPVDVSSETLAEYSCGLIDVDAPAAVHDWTIESWRKLKIVDRPPLFWLARLSHVPAETDDPDVCEGTLFPELGFESVRVPVALAIECWQLRRRLTENQRFALLGQVLGGVLHELKNPLNNLLGGLERLLARVGDADPAVARWSQMAQRNGDLLRESLRTMLDGLRTGVAPEVVSLQAVLDRAALYAIEGDINYRRQLKVEREYAQPSPQVWGATGELFHLFLNLIVNARQALGDAGGVITLRLREDGDGFASVEVHDNGPGIPEEVRAGLFHQYRTTKVGGSGFGLALCQKIAHEHRGTIDCVNGSSAGACFRVRLPIHEAK